MDRRGIIRVVAGVQVSLGLAVLIATAVFSFTYAGRVRTATTAFGTASLSFGEQVNIVVATVESNRDFTLKLGQAVGTYRKLTQQGKQLTITHAKSLAGYERSVLSFADICRAISVKSDKVADIMLFVKWPVDPDFEYTKVIGVSVPTKLTYRLKSILSEEGGHVKEVSKRVAVIETDIRKLAGSMFPEVDKMHKAVADACDTTDAALAQVEVILAKADKEDLPRSLDQMRRAGAALSDAGRSLTEGVTPVLWWTAAGVAVLGVLTMCNGIMLLCLAPGGT